ncbi:DNA-directed RNA polymerase subunit omega [Caldicellulosiruptoraceae bacterium PP1]
MLLKPGLDTLLNNVDNKYTLCVLVAKRARQLLDGAPRRVDIEGDKYVTIAVNEVAAGKVTYNYNKPVKIYEFKK